MRSIVRPRACVPAGASCPAPRAATHRALIATVLVIAASEPAGAGVTNPDISVIGQPFMFVGNDPNDPNRQRPQLEVGEAELVFDAALNPYARGAFTLSIGSEGLDLEEGYFDLLRGLPAGLAIRGGQYRVGFGKLNPLHPHALPFAKRFDVLETYLPGDEAFIETGLSLSRRIPVRGDFSLNVSADWLRGDSFRVERISSGHPSDPLEQGGDDDAGEVRAAFAARISAFELLGEQSGLEVGLSATGGTNNVAAGTHTYVYGADVKAKLWTSPRSYLVLQSEALLLDRKDAAWSPGLPGQYASDSDVAAGGYIYADYNWATRYNLGVSYEGHEPPGFDASWDQAAGAFAGLALLEETTAFRVDWRHVMPEDGDAFDEFTLRVIFSMGPHKAHSF